MIDPLVDPLPPDELMRQVSATLTATLEQEILDRVLTASPAFFERLIVQLLIKMGFGGSLEDAGRVLGKSGDEGVDGVIDEDALGLDQVYVQAKRYKPGNSVTGKDILSFSGSLDMKKAHKGLFVITSTFTPGARHAAENVTRRIVLIDGQQLARLMIHHGVGCRVEETYYVRRIDENFFDPE